MSEHMNAVQLLEGANNCPAVVFNAPGLQVAGWTKALPRKAHVDKRVLRQRKGRPRLTTKVPK